MDHCHPEASQSLKNYLEDTKVDCVDIINWDFSKGFLVKSEIGGWGALIISKGNEDDLYDLSLVSHGHERAFEERIIKCDKVK